MQIFGIDLSSEMIRCATGLNPGIEFRAGDIRALDLPDASLAGIVAFYSIVHFVPAELEAVMREWRRVLEPDGLLLLVFHIGEETVHVDDLYGRPVCLDFHFHQPTEVEAILRSADLIVTESTQRAPYEGAEYASRRCYLLATAGVTVAA